MQLKHLQSQLQSISSTDSIMQLTSVPDRTNKGRFLDAPIDHLGTATSNNSLFVAPATATCQTISLVDLERKGSLPQVCVPKLDLKKLVSVDSIPRSCY